MAAIFYLSAQPAGEELAWWEIAVRKLGHFGGYTALALLWAWALSPRLGRRTLPAALAISVVYALSDEIHQSTVDSRHGTPQDVLIDALGALAGIGLAYWWVRRKLDPALVRRHEDGLSAVERT
jgi:VanZ family protein